jgi:subtilisin family serine protease
VKEFPVELPHGTGVLRLDPSRLLIEFREPRSRDDVEDELGQFELMVEPDDELAQTRQDLRAEAINHTDRRWWVRTRSGRAIDEDLYAALRNQLGEKVAWVGPVYDTPNTPGRGGRVCPLPHVLVLQPSAIAGQEDDPLAAVASRLGLEEDTERSRYLAGWRLFTIPDIDERNAYGLREIIAREFRDAVGDTKFETMPMIRDLTLVPNDPLYPQQWGMAQTNAGGPGTTGWDLTTGSNTIIVAVLDYGFDLTHPDLAYVGGVNLSTMSALTTADSGTDSHGTACCGIIAAGINNAAGVAGLAGACRIMPVRRVSGSDVETATGINWAAANGAHVLSMSFGRYAPGEGASPTGWDFTVVDPAIANAVNVSGCVLCAATGNLNLATVNCYPARHPLVIACGASDQVDNRKSPTSPDGETNWGSNYGTNLYLGVTTGVSVVAPGVLIPTTDYQGTLGYNTAAGTAGDYVLNFNGTSSATPHVAGLAALLRSLYATLTNAQVRSIVERTAAKVGVVAYAEVAGFDSGSRNQEMGYGRIDVFHALDFADAMIRDYPADAGIEPSTPPGGDFWDFSEIVVRATDDNVFNPSDPTQSNAVERGQTNYVYVRVTNLGPREARNVAVSVRITPWVGVEFAYPDDWTLVDANHVSPTPVAASFGTLAAGASVMAKFTISAPQTETLWGWLTGSSWHPCLLAAVSADNDYAFAAAAVAATPVTPRRNNLAQRNLTVVDDVLGADETFPFLAGHRHNRDRQLEIEVDRSLFPRATMRLLLDDQRRFFPSSVYETLVNEPRDEQDSDVIEWLDRTRIRTRLGRCRGILTLEAGSRFSCEHAGRSGDVEVEGGQVILEHGQRVVRLTEPLSRIRIQKRPGVVLPLALVTAIPADAEPGVPLTVRVRQRNEKGVIVGGASATYRPRESP